MMLGRKEMLWKRVFAVFCFWGGACCAAGLEAPLCGTPKSGIPFVALAKAFRGDSPWLEALDVCERSARVTLERAKISDEDALSHKVTRAFQSLTEELKSAKAFSEGNIFIPEAFCSDARGAVTALRSDAYHWPQGCTLLKELTLVSRVVRGLFYSYKRRVDEQSVKEDCTDILFCVQSIKELTCFVNKVLDVEDKRKCALDMLRGFLAGRISSASSERVNSAVCSLYCMEMRNQELGQYELKHILSLVRYRPSALKSAVCQEQYFPGRAALEVLGDKARRTLESMLLYEPQLWKDYEAMMAILKRGEKAAFHFSLGYIFIPKPLRNGKKSIDLRWFTHGPCAYALYQDKRVKDLLDQALCPFAEKVDPPSIMDRFMPRVSAVQTPDGLRGLTQNVLREEAQRHDAMVQLYNIIEVNLGQGNEAYVLMDKATDQDVMVMERERSVLRLAMSLAAKLRVDDLIKKTDMEVAERGCYLAVRNDPGPVTDVLRELYCLHIKTCAKAN